MSACPEVLVREPTAAASPSFAASRLRGVEASEPSLLTQNRSCSPRPPAPGHHPYVYRRNRWGGYPHGFPSLLMPWRAVGICCFLGGWFGHIKPWGIMGGGLGILSLSAPPPHSPSTSSSFCSDDLMSKIRRPHENDVQKRQNGLDMQRPHENDVQKRQNVTP